MSPLFTAAEGQELCHGKWCSSLSKQWVLCSTEWDQTSDHEKRHLHKVKTPLNVAHAVGSFWAAIISIQLCPEVPGLFYEPYQIRTVWFCCWGNCNLRKEPGLCSALLCSFVLLLLPMLVLLQKVTISHFLLFCSLVQKLHRTWSLLWSSGVLPWRSAPVVTGRLCCVIACTHVSLLSRLHAPWGQGPQLPLPPLPPLWIHNLWWIVLSEKMGFLRNLLTCPERGTTKPIPGTFLSQDAMSLGNTSTNLVSECSFLFALKKNWNCWDVVLTGFHIRFAGYFRWTLLGLVFIYPPSIFLF